MKRMRLAVISSLMSAMLLFPFNAGAFDFPRDLPTFEALMALHKAVKKDEDQAVARIATSFGEQSLVTKGAKKFNDVRSTLDSKLNNAYSYVVLAGAISSTANSLYMLTKEYKDFTVNTYKYVSKKPFVAWYYTDANVAIAREIKHARKLYASVAASGINLMKASMGREAEPCDDAEKHHRQCPQDYRQRQSLLLSRDRLRLETGLHLGNPDFIGQG